MLYIIFVFCLSRIGKLIYFRRNIVPVIYLYFLTFINTIPNFQMPKLDHLTLTSTQIADLLKKKILTSYKSLTEIITLLYTIHSFQGTGLEN
jgi:hypothetical protein